MFQRLERDSSKGYQLYDCGSHWELHGPMGICSGKLKDIGVYAVLHLGFTLSEIELGVMEMNKHFHDAAEYGIFRKFLFSYERTKYAKTGTDC